MEMDPSYEIVIKPFRNWRNRTVIKAIADIDRQAFDPSWTELDIRRLLQDANYAILTAHHEKQVVGYLVYSGRQGCFQIINITVHPDHRRRHVGSDLVDALVTYCSQVRNKFMIFAEVRERDLRAQVFFRSLRFRWEQTFPGYFQDNNEDAYLLILRVPEAPPELSPSR